MLLPHLDTVRRDIMRRSFYRFVKGAWNLVEPGRPFIENWHMGAVCEHAQAVAQGEIQYLICNQPPGTAKSLLWAVFWPAWIWTWNPGFRGIFASYDGPLATRDSLKCRIVLESPWYQSNFVNGAWSFDKNQNEKTYYQNSIMGVRQALSVGAGGTGFRGDGTLVDDPLSVKQARSKVARETCLTWWNETMSGRRNNLAKDWRVIVGQRVRSNDLSGEMIRQGGYQLLCLPSEYDPKRSCVTVRMKEGQLIEWRDPRKVQGELLFPQLFPQKVLDKARIELTERGFAGQHQQSPSIEGGTLFKRADWRFWKPNGTAPEYRHPRPQGCYQGPARDLPSKVDQTIISCDFTFKDKLTSDFVDMKVIARCGADRFVLARAYGRMGFSKTSRVLEALCARWPQARKKLIEDTANGPGIIDTLKTKITGLCPRDPAKYGSKTERAELVSPEVESGNWYLPDGAPWLDSFVTELEEFPDGVHDDQVDTLTQAGCEFMVIGAAGRVAALCTPIESFEPRMRIV